MADMLVKLYNIPYSHDIEENLSKSGIRIRKALVLQRTFDGLRPLFLI